MRVPHSWLAELVPGLPDPDETAELLTSIGLAVEAVHRLPGAPEGVVVARIERAEPIAGTDHLLDCSASDGTRSHRVVCGAPNARPGMLAALALPGATLPGLDGPVAAVELRGVPSEGVLCSPRELGVYDWAGGLLELGPDVEPGASLAELWPGDAVLELELTPNRADAFSVLGVARDLAAKLGVPYRDPAADADPTDPSLDDGLAVRVEDEEACPRLTLQRIDGVTVGPSPVWLQRRLALLGLRPRNNVVDVTNYVTHELGQPSHAYDLAALGESTVIVRRARPGETLVALNEDELRFHPDDLVIATPDGRGGSRPIGAAGVIGGLEDSVRAGTRAVALEVAHFDPVVVRRAAKRLGQHTDAHLRFERGVDPNLPPRASARAARLIADLAGGEVHPGRSDAGADRPLRTIAFRPARVRFLTDLEVPAAEQRRLLESLGCTVDEGTEAAGEERWRVGAPSWRFDLAIEEDLVEEVARLHGYDKIGESVPPMHFVPPPTDPTHHALRLLLVGMGFQETISYVFTGEEELARAAAPEARVRLSHPQGEERAVLRTALHPSLLQAAAANPQRDALALFEIGRVFGDEETERLGLLAAGSWEGEGWLPPRPLDAWLVKGLLERLADAHGAELRLVPGDAPHLHPGVRAAILWNDRPIGHFGRLHPSVASAYGLTEAYVAELELPLATGRSRFRDVDRQPHAERDLAVVAPREVPFAELRERAVRAAGERLVSLEPFDVYEGPPVPEGQRSVALRLRFRHPERSLTDPEVDAFMENVIGALREAGYDIRDR